MLKDYLASQGESVYAISKKSNIPYTTLNELVLGKKDPRNCSINTVAALAYALHLSLDDMYRIILDDREDGPNPATTWEDARYKKYRFHVVCDEEAEFLSSIHPLKQKQVLELYKLLNTLDAVRGAVIFGSSTNIRCGKDSDLDIAVELQAGKVDRDVKNDVSERIQNATGYNADIIWMDHVESGSRLSENIERGVRII